MQSASPGPHEKERLAALEEYNILDTLPEKEFDNITALASEICQTPISLVTLVDGNRQWFKSHHGVAVSETPREYAFCAHAINRPDEILEVSDSRTDPRFSGNPLVTGEPKVIFYTGVPLTNDQGYALGTLCVIDHRPKKLSGSQLISLRALGNQVVSLLELHKAKRSLERMRDELESRNKELEQFAYVVSHDIKSPLSSIVLTTEVLRESYGEKPDAETEQLLGVLTRASFKIKNLVDGILSYYKGESSLSGKVDEFFLADLVQSIRGILSPQQPLEIELPAEPVRLLTNKIGLEQVFLNLFQNSIRYNDKDKTKIRVAFSGADEFYRFEVSDNGRGIAPENQQRIFDLFHTLGARDRYGNMGSGIGLAIVKKIVKSQDGEVTVHSVPGESTTFLFSLRKPAP